MNSEFPFFDSEYFERLRELRELKARWDQMMRDVYGEDEEEQEATRIQVVAARPSPATCSIYEAMGVKTPWYVRVKSYFTARKA